MDLFSNTHLTTLLRQADTAQRMLDTVESDARADVEDALRSIYADIGKLVHTLRGPGLFHDDHDDHLFSLEDEEDENEEIQYTEEVSLFEEPIDDWHTDEASLPIRPVPALPERVDVHAFILEIPEIPGRLPPWFPHLQDLLSVLGSPDGCSGEPEFAVETTRIQWATNGMGQTWMLYPPAVQIALLGMLTARARHLLDTEHGTVGSLLALERLRSYQQQTSLPGVAGLDAEPSSEFRTWLDDAAFWFNTLRQGLVEVERKHA